LKEGGKSLTSTEKKMVAVIKKKKKRRLRLAEPVGGEGRGIICLEGKKLFCRGRKAPC